MFECNGITMVQNCTTMSICPIAYMFVIYMIACYKKLQFPQYNFRRNKNNKLLIIEYIL